MAYFILIDIVNNKYSTVEELKSVLQSLPNVKSEINSEPDRVTLLSAAISNQKSVEFVEELIKHGADVDRDRPLFLAYRYLVESRNKLYLSIMKLLLDYGACINSTIFYEPFHVSYHPVQDIPFRIEILFPVTKLILQHASRRTLSLISICLIEHALQFSSDHDPHYKEPHLLNIIYRVLKLLLESGVRPSRGYFINCIEYFILWAPNANTLFWRELLQLIVPHILAKNIVNNFDIPDYTAYEGGRNVLVKRCQVNPNVARNLNLLKHLWNECLGEFKNMQNDKLTHNSSATETLQVLLCGSGEELASVRSDTVYELMLRLAQGKYPHFNDIMSHAVKKTDLNGVYILVTKQHFGNDYAIHPDCFFIVAKFLSKDDLFNFLIALLPYTL